MGRRPGGVTAICVIAIVLASLGICGAIYQGVALALQSTILAQPPAGDELSQMQNEMQRQMIEATRPLTPFQIFLLAANLGASIALLAAAILALSMRPSGRGWLAGASVGCAAVDLLGAGLGLLAAVKSWPVVAEFTRKMAERGGSMAQAGGVMKFAVAVAIGLQVIWLMLKLGFYITSVVYLQRPNVRQAFLPPQS